MKLNNLMLIVGLMASSSVFAAGSDQAAIDTLQKQIQDTSTQCHQAIAAQQAQTQKAIADLQAQTQAQLSHMQAQMQKMQDQLTQDIKQVQAEMQQVNAAPTAKAAPAKK